MSFLKTDKKCHADELADIMNRVDLDIRMVTAIAGDRAMNARERHILERVMTERGEGIYSDMLYALTHRAFPAKQAKHLWDEIGNHRAKLKGFLGRDVGIAVATHDYLTNVASLMKNVSMIEEAKVDSLTNVATRDGLTGLFDHSTFKHRLKEELERQVRYGGALSLVMFDIDHFKNLNDTHGHTEGDRVLKQVSDLIRAQVRTVDIAARYGGEEFAIILPGVELKAGLIFAERLRQAIAAGFEDEAYQVTVSLGIETSEQAASETSESLIKKADAELYRAKRSGRNKVCSRLDTPLAI